MGQACFKDPQYTTSHPDEACPIFSRECSHAVYSHWLVASWGIACYAGMIFYFLDLPNAGYYLSNQKLAFQDEL
jgi:hypothetical protein